MSGKWKKVILSKIATNTRNNDNEEFERKFQKLFEPITEFETDYEVVSNADEELTKLITFDGLANETNAVQDFTEDYKEVMKAVKAEQNLVSIKLL